MCPEPSHPSVGHLANAYAHYIKLSVCTFVLWLFVTNKPGSLAIYPTKNTYILNQHHLWSALVCKSFARTSIQTVASPASGHVGTCPPLTFERFFSLGYKLKQVVWFALVYMPNSNSALFVQPYSLWNDAIIGYNACVCKNCFTARRHALARSLLSAGVRLSVTFV